jgi:hypothetical protein
MVAIFLTKEILCRLFSVMLADIINDSDALFYFIHR